MTGADWCHFAARVERSALHRRLKGGALGHEDEKFTYVAVSRVPVVPVPARVVRHPLRRPGHAALELCTPTGLVRRAVTKRERQAWRAARRARWGDAWDPEEGRGREPGAGVGALAGGKKGALVGAAIGGGAATLFEAFRR